MTKKPASKKAPAKKAASKKAASKSVTKKPAAKKAPAKKAAASTSTAKKAASKKPAAKKAATKKAASSKSAPSKKAPAKKAPAKKAPAKKPAPSKAPAKTATKTEPKAEAKASKAAESTGSKATGSKPTGAQGDAKGADGKPARKGITIVDSRPRKKAAAPKFSPPPSTLGSLLNKRKRQPLIPSGPNAPTSEFSTFGDAADGDAKARKVKSPYKKRELDAFRETLMLKRRELAGDVEEMERGMAALGDRGGDPALDVAEQGSDAYDQSLSIGLAEADRKLIREIDEAIKRIDEGVFGVCEVTKEPIGAERLKELPWTRLSIEAARDAERRGAPR
ncbi:MAG: TraR/DksA family transcriptional regulator [Planctomycetota bacterium]